MKIESAMVIINKVHPGTFSRSDSAPLTSEETLVYRDLIGQKMLCDLVHMTDPAEVRQMMEDVYPMGAEYKGFLELCLDRLMLLLKVPII